MSPQRTGGSARRRIAGDAVRRRREAASAASAVETTATRTLEQDAEAVDTVEQDAPADDTEKGAEPEVVGASDADPNDGSVATEPTDRPSGWLIAPPKRTWRWLGPMLVLTVAAVVFAAVVGFQYAAERGDDAAFVEGREDAASAAATAAESILGYDHRTIEVDRTAAEELMTDDFGTEYDRLYSGKYCEVLPEANCTETGSFKEVVKQREQTVEVSVTDVGTLECGDECRPDEAKVLMFIDKATTTGGGEPRPSGTQATFTMVKQDGDWLVDDIQ